mmetsp:Transcript_16589/g.21957  ORF Transcript_16589/g.21957 Transcript_16589/m.21957 type:complete len:346 (-) Transcript_16589:281-1318(-)
MDFENLKSDTEHLTMTRFIMSDIRDADLAILMSAITLSCKVITRAVRKAGIADLYGLAGAANATGDDVKKLDLISDEVMCNALLNSGVCAVLVSEEQEEPIIVPEDKQGKYVVAFDPLDGSSNVDCNVSTGTIFGVWEKKSDGPATVQDALNSGNDLVVSGYCMYGSATDMVVTFGSGVHRFTYDPSIGEFVHTLGNIMIPEKPKLIYSANEGNFNSWDPEIKQAVEGYKNNEPKPFSARYVGSMVSDVHRTILYGGIYLYPADKKSPNGKLRLMYEGLPMAMLVEQCGGVATTGMFKGSIQRVLDIKPETIHERSPIILGNAEFVDRVTSLYGQSAVPPPPPAP